MHCWEIAERRIPTNRLGKHRVDRYSSRACIDVEVNHAISVHRVCFEMLLVLEHK